MKPVYILGHKHPDMDSIAAAISYKIFKDIQGPDHYIAAAAGELNEESVFVLNHLGFEPPEIIRDVRSKAEDILDQEKALYVHADTTLAQLAAQVREEQLKTIPVLDEKKQLLGLFTIGDVAMLYMNALDPEKDISHSVKQLREFLDLPVSKIMKSRDLILFESTESIDDVKKMMLSTRYRNYPVVDETNRLLGMISRYHLLNLKRKRVILVDHNESKQAVEGIEEAEILEIIDHHRVGDLQTTQPILFHNEPVGSTCTLIAEMFFKHTIDINANLAGLMLAGIVADTMIFKSPTTTLKDKAIARKLEVASGLDALQWGYRIFETTTKSELKTEYEIINEDLKEYSSGSMTFAIAQIETMGRENFSRRKVELIDTMNLILRENGYGFLCLMVTDIYQGETELMMVGGKSDLIARAFGQKMIEHSIFLRGIMSRKKQVVPLLFEALRQEEHV